LEWSAGLGLGDSLSEWGIQQSQLHCGVAKCSEPAALHPAGGQRGHAGYDDVTVHADAARTRDILDLLLRLSTERQVVVSPRKSRSRHGHAST
jgi:hypothetical protein